ncbi:hypothetical protein DXV75_07730 [Alteromonas aestuariivivens]|uniref:Photosynthesis system II assembly factor Ycf48/Hcf136-like domain-containing protein n=1 Tax=Alteromonas aestuariivivens TaxID=1938339 RepID=A0A3D8M854_9ALTE|nr:hypothetical protein [Alteromonas aestuariivivens]RDV25969.1 hypothetical protein DXV75_07730 [Alteromonas aestuariivivens]
MKNALASVLVTSAITFSASAQEAFLAPLVEQSVLLDVAASDYLVVVGERGHILTSNNGVDFTQSAVPTQSTLTATAAVGDRVWAVGHDATILHSADRGQSWQTQMQEPDLERPFLDIVFWDQAHGIAIGAYGLFYRTLDGGVNWRAERHATLLDPMDQEYLEQIREEDEAFYQQELDSILPHLNRVTRAGEKLYLAGEAGLLAVSEDQGRSWVRFDVDYTGSFFDVQPLDENTILAVGLRGNMFVRREQGDWEYVNTCSDSTLNSVLPLQSEVIAMGNNGIIIHAQRPLPVSEPDPYASSVTCEPPAGITMEQISDKAAILNAVQFDGKVIAVTANGIKQLNKE